MKKAGWKAFGKYDFVDAQLLGVFASDEEAMNRCDSEDEGFDEFFIQPTHTAWGKRWRRWNDTWRSVA